MRYSLTQTKAKNGNFVGVFLGLWEDEIKDS